MKNNMDTLKQSEIDELNERMRNTRKLILIENWEDLGLKPKKRKEFVKFYYNNLEMNLTDALEVFKKKK